MSNREFIIDCNGNPAIKAGDIEFYDRFTPPLESAQYTLEAIQTVEGVASHNDGKTPTFSASQTFLIDGPRFSVKAQDVQSFYPPANHAGLFGDHLPNIVFRNRSLPWSRDICDKSAEPDPKPRPPTGTPWMALITLYPDDLGNKGNAQIEGPTQLAVSDIIPDTAPKDVLIPKIKLTGGQAQKQASALEMDYAFFKQVAPAQDELHFLGHGRQVNTAGKAINGIQGEGFYSLMVGNRVVQSGGNNTVILVSLEGHWDRLPGGVETGQPTGTRIRLVVLASWVFEAKKSPGDFLGLMKALCLKGRGGVDLLRLPVDGGAGTSGDAATDPAAQAREVLELGYVPLANDLRIGEKTTSYYRGPFVAIPTALDHSYGPFHYSDQTIHYDPKFGTFNLAYAAAFQIGRLLALSSPAFALDLVQWRKNLFYLENKLAEKQVFQQPLANLVRTAAQNVGSAPDATTAAESYGDPETMHAAVRQLWHGAVGLTLFSDMKSVPRIQPRHIKPVSDNLPGVMSDEEIENIHESGDEPLVAILDKLRGRTNQ